MNNKLDITLNELSMIEDALHYRLRRLTMRKNTVKKKSSVEKIELEVRDISLLLGKIHNQKEFHRPKGMTYISG